MQCIKIIYWLIVVVLSMPSLVYGARGFGATDGVASTDVLTMSSTTVSHTLRSYWVRFKVNAFAATASRILNNSDTIMVEDVTFTATVGLISYTAGWGTQNGVWTVAAPTTGVWHTLGITYNGGATTNDPIFYYDNTTPAVTEALTPSGTLNSATQLRYIGNVVGANRVMDGTLAEVSVWNVILTAAEMTALFNGNDPATIQTAAIRQYYKLCGKDSPELTFDKVSQSMTVTGTKYKDHPVATCLSPTSMTGVGR